MKKNIPAFILLIFICSCSTYSQKGNSLVNDTIIKQANEMGQLIRKKDSEQFISKLYPEFVIEVGGKEKMMWLLNKGYSDLEKQSISIDSVSFLLTNPIIDTGNELQTTLTEILLLKTSKGRMVTKSTLIAISKDKGSIWYFLDTSGRDLKIMQQRFPNLSDKLIIEPMEKPILYRK